MNSHGSQESGTGQAACRRSVWRCRAPIVAVLMCVMLAAGGPAAGQSQTPETAPENVRFFEKNVRPVLVARCLKCHGTKTQWGGLRLDSRPALLRGGESGAAVIPGQPEKSLLIQAVRHLDDDLKMPQDGKLTARQIQKLVRWIEMGAPFPAGTSAVERLRDPQHWAFQPLPAPTIPATPRSDWPRSAIDRLLIGNLISTTRNRVHTVERLMQGERSSPCRFWRCCVKLRPVRPQNTGRFGSSHAPSPCRRASVMI